jgi:acyl-CoA synthetase (NDP forming)
LRSRKLAVMSISGGAGVQIADFASTAGLELIPPPEATQHALRELIPFGSPANPVDVTAQVGNQPGIFGETMKLLIDAGYDSILAWLAPALTNIKAGAAMRDAVILGARDNPQVLSSVSVIAGPDVVRAFEDAGCLVFEERRTSCTSRNSVASRWDWIRLRTQRRPFAGCKSHCATARPRPASMAISCRRCSRQAWSASSASMQIRSSAPW